MSKRFILPLLIVCAAFFGVALFLPRGARAQCGSSASSCKNCHEVQAKAPVNTKGDWHTQHAFGDFCEFCHAGNVKAKDQAAAHTAMVDPLADVKGSCQACHPNDYMDRAKKYGDALGKPVGTGAVTANATPAAGAAGTTSGGTTAPCGPAAPTGGQVIDLNKIYAGADQAAPSNLGNTILLGLIGATLLVLLGLVWHFEKPLPRLYAYFQALVNMPVMTAATAEGITLPVQGAAARRPESAAIERALAASDPATVRAVTQLLSDREHGPKILQALSHSDLKTLAALGENDQTALTALLKLAREMNA